MTKSRARTGAALAALALGMSIASTAAFAQFGPYYSSDRKVNDNGSVYEPTSAANRSMTEPVRHRRHLVNYAPRTQETSQARHYYPGVRRPDDNGSVDEQGPSR